MKTEMPALANCFHLAKYIMGVLGEIAALTRCRRRWSADGQAPCQPTLNRLALTKIQRCSNIVYEDSYN